MTIFKKLDFTWITIKLQFYRVFATLPQMIMIFFTLYAQRLARLLRNIGFLRSVVVVVLVFATLARICTLDLPLAYTVSALWLLSLAWLHVNRNDRTFLRLIDAPTYWLHAVEYHLLASPIYVTLLKHGRWVETMAGFLIVCLIPLLRITLSPRFAAVYHLSFIPDQAFEWKSGLRRYGWIILPLYLVALVLYEYPFAALLMIIVFTLITVSFYNEAEPLAMVEARAAPPAAFLRAKWRTQLTLFWIGCLPLAIIFLLNNTTYWYVLPVWCLICSILQILSINLKYSLYEPGQTYNRDVYMAIYFLSLFVPYFVPVPLLMMFYYARRARRNLSLYLYDPS